MSTLDQRLTANVAIRREVVGLLELIGDKPVKYWEVLIEEASAKLPPKPSAIVEIEAMDDKEAAKFEESLVPFGKYDGEEVCNVPIGYLIRLTEDNAWVTKLKRYLKSPMFKRRQDEEDNG